MRHLTNLAYALVGAALVVAGSVYAATKAQPNSADLGALLTAAGARPCLYPSGGWTTIDSDNSGGNASGTLSTWTTYAVQCDADAYVSFGGTAADSSDGWLAAGAIVRFTNAGDATTFSVLNKSDATADCHYIECR